MQNNTAKRWVYLLTGTVMMIILGLIYAWSIFVKPLEADFGWTRGQTSFTFTTCIAFFVVGLISAGFMAKRLSKRVCVLIAAAFMLAGFVLCSRVTSLVGLYISYGVLVGFGVGVANNALVSTLVKWFPDMTGLASGILMMGFGIGGLVLGPIAVSLMASMGWRNTFLLLGIVFAVIMAAGSLVVVLPPQNYGAPSGKAQKQENPDLSPGKVVRRPSFWLYICWFTLVMAGGLIVIGHASPFAGELGFTAGTAAVATGVLSLFNGFGRVLTGITYDKLGLKVSMRLMSLYLVLAAALLVGASYFQSPVLMIAGFIFTGLSYGGGPTTSSTFSTKFYGPKDFAMNYSIVSAGMIPGAVIGPFLAGNLQASSGGYLTSFIAMLIFACVAFVFLQFIKKP